MTGAIERGKEEKNEENETAMRELRMEVEREERVTKRGNRERVRRM